MSAAPQSRDNHILDALPPLERERLFPHLRLVPMPPGMMLYESGAALRNVYFLTDSIISTSCCRRTDGSKHRRTSGRFSARCACEQRPGRFRHMLRWPEFPAPQQSPVKSARVPADNLLLAALPAAARRRLTADSAPVNLFVPEILSEAGDRIRHVYFPIDGFISLITPAHGRGQLEIGLVGSEGMLGVPLLLGVNMSPLRAMVQGEGRAWRVDAGILQQELAANPGVRAVLNHYLYVFLAQLMQTATCTRFHLIEARLARWLLMTRDRAHSNQFHLTHEFLALMLGVRRVGVTSAASALQRRKLIRYRRGDIAILDVRSLERAACPCYTIDKQIYSRIFARKSRQPGTATTAATLLAAQITSSIAC